MNAEELAKELKTLLAEWDAAITVGQTKAPRERLWFFIETHGVEIAAILDRAAEKESTSY